MFVALMTPIRETERINILTTCISYLGVRVCVVVCGVSYARCPLFSGRIINIAVDSISAACTRNRDNPNHNCTGGNLVGGLMRAMRCDAMRDAR